MLKAIAAAALIDELAAQGIGLERDRDAAVRVEVLERDRHDVRPVQLRQAGSPADADPLRIRVEIECGWVRDTAGVCQPKPACRNPRPVSVPTVPSWKNTSTVTGGCTSGVPNQRVACGEMWTSSGPCLSPASPGTRASGRWGIRGRAQGDEPARHLDHDERRGSDVHADADAVAGDRVRRPQATPRNGARTHAGALAAGIPKGVADRHQQRPAR